MTQINMDTDYDYQKAFGRNIGFISASDQEKLKNTRVAIAGVGGVGGAYVHVLARLGIGKYTLADHDIFEVTNFNRQLGASQKTVGKKKTEVYRELIEAINPEAEINVVEDGINESTIDSFLDRAEIIFDALDFYCFEERKILYQKAREKKLWIINIAPTGFGMTLMTFDPQGMSLEDYFDFKDGMNDQEKTLAMAFGVNPTPLILKYLDRSSTGLKHKGSLPCVSPAFFLAAGVAGTEAVKILLKRGNVRAIPWVTQYDAFLQSYKQKFYPMGMRSPWQRLKRKIALKTLS